MRAYFVIILILIWGHPNYATTAKCFGLFEDRVWKMISQDIVASIEEDINFKSGFYKSRDSFAISLRNLMGSKLNKPPTPELFIEKYNEKIKTLILKRIISEKEVLRPAIPFAKAHKDNSREFIWLEWGQNIPKSYEVEGVTYQPIFLKMLAEGYFPLSMSKRVTTGISGFEHDMAHFTAFLDNPHYMSLLRKYAQKLVESRNINKRYTSEELSSLLQSPVGIGYFLTEGLLVIRPDKKEELKSKLLIPKRLLLNPQKADYESILRYLQSLDVVFVRDRMVELSVSYEKYIMLLGGSARDPGSQYSHPLHNPLLPILEKINLPPFNGIDNFSLHNAARFELALLRLIDLRLEDWFTPLKRAPSAPEAKQWKKDVLHAWLNP